MSTLVLDADDTLWENNVRFERVVESYLDWVDHPSLDRVAVRAVLNDVESANAGVHGYGVDVFLRSLHDCFQRLAERPGTDAERAEIDALTISLRDHRVELMPQVRETLEELGGRHRLRLLTKGHPADQQAKVDASGLAELFEAIHIVPEKNLATYQNLSATADLVPAMTWMIGNSPRSDINRPERRAGVRCSSPTPIPGRWSMTTSTTTTPGC